ncbi:TetR/AcrR family transcriptional regulator [Pseudoalteromonas sp. SWN166]|uniref:TetR/AcrR family transcriptional regulator n=1 Tax=Pseudoalteromonas sp. SWN166 TaxID=2792061 RepID=UPI0018CF076E|nr:TetR/AcrR family transcriptional regulator [Pseudoalteromonas sp. SWN166]MBH0038480.1 TetR/AcrR family transcriptional regulator [Pseudoalteromonas sp. SWN166]
MNKREQIITTALNLFYNKGIHAVGINEILAVSGIAKKTLYNHFLSKDDLILACLAMRDKNFNNWLKQTCEKQNAFDVASGLFAGLTSWFNNAVPELGDFNGCFFINAAAEYPFPAHSIAIQCKAHKHAVLKIILNALLATPQLRNNKVKAENIAQTLFTLKEGLICQARVMHNQSLVMPSTALLKHIIQS